MACKHPEIDVEMTVGHPLDGEDGPEIGTIVQLRARCRICGHPYRFLGVIESQGVSFQVPSCGPFGGVLRLPITAMTDGMVTAYTKLVQADAMQTGKTH